jgi:hypothetical protein
MPRNRLRAMLLPANCLRCGRSLTVPKLWQFAFHCFLRIRTPKTDESMLGLSIISNGLFPDCVRQLTADPDGHCCRLHRRSQALEVVHAYRSRPGCTGAAAFSVRRGSRSDANGSGSPAIVRFTPAFQSKNHPRGEALCIEHMDREMLQLRLMERRLLVSWPRTRER